MQKMNNGPLLVWLLMILSITACSKKKNHAVPDGENSKPEITSFDPVRGVPGTVVTIKGKHFREGTAENKIRFNGSTVDAEITAASTTELKVKVPVNATTGKITFMAGDEFVISSTDFTVDPVPTSITSFVPKQGPFGTAVTITGVNFANNAAVEINGIPVSITRQSSTEIVIVIPVNTTLSTHKLKITSGGTVLETTDNFTVTAPGAYASWDDKGIKLIAQPDAGAFHGGASFVHGNKIYWGFSNMFVNSNKAEYVVYDPASTQPQFWMSQHDAPVNLAPEGAQNIRAVVSNGRVFLGTGLRSMGSTNKWFEFHPATNSATELTAFPHSVSGLVPFVMEQKIYAGFGGTNTKLYEFDPAANAGLGSWNERATGGFRELNTGSAIVLNNEAYMGSALPGLNQARNGFYKFSGGVITRVADLPDVQQVQYTSSFILGNKGYYVIGKRVWEYTPGTNGGSWRAVLADPTAPSIVHTAVLTVNGQEVVYGWTSSGWVYQLRFN